MASGVTDSVVVASALCAHRNVAYNPFAGKDFSAPRVGPFMARAKRACESRLRRGT
jgi:hypothetical protein